MDPEKMKVIDLRDELKNRGLDTKGNKAQLVKRLKEVLDQPDADASFSHLKDESQDDADLGASGDATLDEDTTEQYHDADENQVEGQLVENNEPHQDDSYGQEEQPVVMAQEEHDDFKQESLEIKQEPHHAEDVDNKAEIDIKEEPNEANIVAQAGGDASQFKLDEGDRKRKYDDYKKASFGDEIEDRTPKEIDYSWLDDTIFQIDRYNNDLNLDVDDGFHAKPRSTMGFAYMWAGCRATYGVCKGKVAYEVKIVSHTPVPHLESDERNPHVLRVGWAPDSASTQLGEEALSYGYGGTAKKSVDCSFSDYGVKFSKDDVITAYLDMDSDPAVMSFSVNGNDQGEAFTVSHDELGGQALFPSILSKNSGFELNFGGREEPWFPLTEGYMFLEALDQEDRVRGSVPNEKKEDCELIMMVGLPGCGKTTWATKFSAENPEKKYYVLGTNNIIDKMKVMGLPRKKNYHGRWDVLIDLATKCLNKLFFLGARERRNYILDQTNVYSTARRRKMQPFEGFHRKAVVIVPTDDDYKVRCEAQSKVEGKEVPESAILEMKANFTPPVSSSYIDEVEYIELQAEEAAELIKTYNEDAAKRLPPPEKRPRGNFNQGGVNRGRGGWQQRGGRGGWNRDGGDRSGRGFRGGYNRTNDYNSGGYNRGGGYKFGGGGGYNRGGGGGGGYNRGSGGYNRGGSNGSYNRGGGGFNRGGGYGRGGYNNRDSSSGYWDNRSGRGNKGGNQSSGGGYNNKSNPWAQGRSSGGWGNQSSWNSQGWGSNSSQLQQYGASQWNSTGGGQQGSWGGSSSQSSWGQPSYWSNQQSGYSNQGYGGWY